MSSDLPPSDLKAFMDAFYQMMPPDVKKMRNPNSKSPRRPPGELRDYFLLIMKKKKEANGGAAVPLTDQKNAYSYLLQKINQSEGTNYASSTRASSPGYMKGFKNVGGVLVPKVSNFQWTSNLSPYGFDEETGKKIRRRSPIPRALSPYQKALRAEVKEIMKEYEGKKEVDGQTGICREFAWKKASDRIEEKRENYAAGKYKMYGLSPQRKSPKLDENQRKLLSAKRKAQREKREKDLEVAHAINKNYMKNAKAFAKQNRSPKKAIPPNVLKYLQSPEGQLLTEQLINSGNSRASTSGNVNVPMQASSSGNRASTSGNVQNIQPFNVPMQASSSGNRASTSGNVQNIQPFNVPLVQASSSMLPAEPESMNIVPTNTDRRTREDLRLQELQDAFNSYQYENALFGEQPVDMKEKRPRTEPRTDIGNPFILNDQNVPEMGYVPEIKLAFRRRR